MTICIAAITENLRAIVTVSDTRLSSVAYSHEYGTVKIRPLINGWAAMFSGDPTTFYSLLRHMNSWLTKHNQPEDVVSMQQAIETAYDAVLEHHIERTILVHLRMTCADFKKNGRRQLSDAVYARIEGEMKAAAAWRRDDPDRTELLVLGFDDNEDPHLLRANADGTCINRNSPGFDAIGSGSDLAYASLQLHDEFVRSKRLGEVCYRLQAAKFAAESSGFVGPVQTITTVFNLDGPAGMSAIQVNHGALEARAYFDAEKARGIPEAVLNAVEGSLRIAR